MHHLGAYIYIYVCMRVFFTKVLIVYSYIWKRIKAHVRPLRIYPCGFALQIARIYPDLIREAPTVEGHEAQAIALFLCVLLSAV